MKKNALKLFLISICVFGTLSLLASCGGVENSDEEKAPESTENAVATTTATTTTTAAVTTTATPSQETFVPDDTYKYVAFTFDDGPHNEWTKKIVDKLAEYDGRATFFVVGDRINEKSAETIKYAVERGNEIGMHSFTHTHTFDTCDDAIYNREVNYTKNRLSAYAGVNATLLRPPGGLMSSERIQNSEYPVIMWSVDSEDWKYKKTGNDEQSAENIGAIVDNVLSTVGEGDIILMHDIYENTYRAFSVIIETLYNEGYRFITVSELLGDGIKSGAKFHSVTLN